MFAIAEILEINLSKTSFRLRLFHPFHPSKLICFSTTMPNFFQRTIWLLNCVYCRKRVTVSKNKFPLRFVHRTFIYLICNSF
jgi:hypothetical protein